VVTICLAPQTAFGRSGHRQSAYSFRGSHPAYGQYPFVIFVTDIKYPVQCARGSPLLRTYPPPCRADAYVETNAVASIAAAAIATSVARNTPSLLSERAPPKQKHACFAVVDLNPLEFEIPRNDRGLDLAPQPAFGRSGHRAMPGGLESTTNGNLLSRQSQSCARYRSHHSADHRRRHRSASCGRALRPRWSHGMCRRYIRLLARLYTCSDLDRLRKHRQARKQQWSPTEPSVLSDSMGRHYDASCALPEPNEPSAKETILINGQRPRTRGRTLKPRSRSGLNWLSRCPDSIESRMIGPDAGPRNH
jgi:hypothetical protein